MRLPQDAALILIDLQKAIDDTRWGPRNNPDAEQRIVELLAAWRAAEMPVVHVRRDSIEPDSPYAPESVGHVFKPEAAPVAGELIVPKQTHSAFIDGALEAALDAIGATQLVMCGVLTNNSLEASARHAGDLGYRVFVVADACWAVERRDGEGRVWAAEDVHRHSLANLSGEYAEITTSGQAIAAAELAAARRRAKANPPS
jgi:nicotinamidase-related amidase